MPIWSSGTDPRLMSGLRALGMELRYRSGADDGAPVPGSELWMPGLGLRVPGMELR